MPLPADLIGTVRYGGKGCLALDGKKVMYLSRRRRLGILLVDFGNDAMALAALNPGLRGACDEMYERREDPFSSLERSVRSARYRLDRHHDPQAASAPSLPLRSFMARTISHACATAWSRCNLRCMLAERKMSRSETANINPYPSFPGLASRAAAILAALTSAASQRRCGRQWQRPSSVRPIRLAACRV